MALLSLIMDELVDSTCLMGAKCNCLVWNLKVLIKRNTTSAPKQMELNRKTFFNRIASLAKEKN